MDPRRPCWDHQDRQGGLAGHRRPTAPSRTSLGGIGVSCFVWWGHLGPGPCFVLTHYAGWGRCESGFLFYGFVSVLWDFLGLSTTPVLLADLVSPARSVFCLTPLAPGVLSLWESHAPLPYLEPQHHPACWGTQRDYRRGRAVEVSWSPEEPRDPWGQLRGRGCSF